MWLERSEEGGEGGGEGRGLWVTGGLGTFNPRDVGALEGCGQRRGQGLAWFPYPHLQEALPTCLGGAHACLPAPQHPCLSHPTPDH